MNNALSLAQLKFDVWLIEQLQYAPEPGLTLEELKNRWNETPGHLGGLSRDRMTTHRRNIRNFWGLEINAPDRKHYRITNPESLALNTLANELLKSIQNYSFLQEFQDLGDLIQPEKIKTGAHYLQQIGQAMRDRHKLHIVYQKFSDTMPYKAIVHPYCLKADKGRWYMLAYKEGNEHQNPMQCFALDRTKQLAIISETFIPTPDIDITSYFRDCFGVWHDFDEYPVQDFTISCTETVAHYLRTLPLHHSQKESPFREGPEGRIVFHYHISPTPDFIAELRKWGDELSIKGQ